MHAPTDAFAQPVEAVAAALEVDPARGLSQAEAERRAATAGANELEEAERESVLSMIWEAATEPFVLLLLAAALGAILLGEIRDGLLVLVGLIPIVGADVVTEYRGERALEALREAAAPRATVRRDGTTAERPAAELVPGDVVVLRAGDIVPADVRLTSAERLLLDRSALTGESVPEPASVQPDGADTPLVDRRALAFSGMGVVAGRGEGIVVATGAETEVGRIARKLGASDRHRSPLQRELDRLVRILLVVAIGLIVIVTGLGFIRGQTLGENFLAGISAAIAAIPEEPPILLAVILGLGAYRLLRRGVLVRRLNAEETLGAIDLIVTDKTGTLTRNRLEVVSVVTAHGPLGGGEVGSETDPAQAAERRAILLDALCAEDDAWVGGSGVAPGSFTRALLDAVQSGGEPLALDPSDLVESLPASDTQKYACTIAREGEGTVKRILGAPETVLGMTDTDEATAERWLAAVDAGADAGERLVALARARDDGPLEMVALIGFADRLRDGIQEAFESAREAGIATIVVTGDHPGTAAAIARAAGIHGNDDEPASVRLGETLANMDDAALTGLLPDLRVIARSTPDGKERLVRLAKAAGRTVAVTGDGVNDAPALQRADIAVAMGSGTAVAKGASDLVLGDDSFATLMFGLAEGRRIVDNVQKGLVFIISTHVALLGFILIATIAGFGQPLLPLQILWLELFIDISTSIAFERERAEPDLMRRPPRPPAVPLLDNELLGRISVAGAFSAVAALVVMLVEPGSAQHAQWFAYTMLVCAQVVRAYANRSLRTPLHRLPPNTFLLAAALIVVTIQIAIPYVPALAEAFRATPLALNEWLVVAVVALAPAVVAEVWRTLRGTRWVA